jgi:hypothetical protein
MLSEDDGSAVRIVRFAGFARRLRKDKVPDDPPAVEISAKARMVAKKPQIF